MLVNDLGLIDKLKIRLLGSVELNGSRELGFCIHHGYYWDYKHWKGGPRCPVCDKIWLKKREEEMRKE